ncbi:GNAT family N-acetyltransferase [Allokutzneria albata]|uniref:Predicted acetyltransferase n=1 Tax=Allokutzneria albata TaxID=211114 RepID=A0A1G9RED6_ALLAB|nr:GNAT family N-acetyltransferase [Allokutzneria albata]SDM20785.1 Predicted acetyltransferase [Allokutzneria albata]
MSDYRIRVLDEDEKRAAQDLFLGSLHAAPVTDEMWEYSSAGYPAERCFGAFREGRIVGSAQSFAATMAVPGGAVLPLAAVSRVGVRADHTRRGVMTELMRAQLRELGEPLASLHATEPVIYGRFGYGVACRGRTVEVEATRGRAVPPLPGDGEIRLLETDELAVELPKIYERIGLHRPGMMSRPRGWWRMVVERRLAQKDHLVAAVHSGPDGDDGFALYEATTVNISPDQRERRLDVHDMHGASLGVVLDLWRFLLGADLVRWVRAWGRPLDEHVELIVPNRGDCRTIELTDETWLRLVDVPTALAARTYGPARPVVVEVHDRFLPENSGRYRVGPDGVRRTDASADLELPVDSLAMLYLGDISASALAATGRLTVREASALTRADRLFTTDRPPNSGTFF